MKRFAVTLALMGCLAVTVTALAFLNSLPSTKSEDKHGFLLARRDLASLALGFFTVTAVASAEGGGVPSCWAFDGSGASTSLGYNPATRLEKRLGYQKRVVADVRYFNALGAAIGRGELVGKEWVNFFIELQRREVDPFGRAYAALVDLRGVPKGNKEYKGGNGLLLANTFTKAGKPPDNTPSVKSFQKLSPTFDGIKEAAKTGDLAKTQAAYAKTKALFAQYLQDVDLPGDLNDPLYK